jgi:hypothetical protein
MGEFGTAAAKAGLAVARECTSAALRRWRPDTSHAALNLHADDLADRVRRAETPSLEQLGVTRGQGVDVYYEALARVRGAGGEDLGSLQEVWDYYSALRPGRLVVLGEPGSGKTVLARQLLLDLLDHRHHHPAVPQPVPVRVNAASWNVETHFSTWLAESLAADYGLLPPVARKLVEDGRVLPVLDGLDEMDPLGAPPKRARAAVEQLNQPPWRGRPVILTCRAAVYDSVRALRPGGADAGLHTATAVTMSKLSPPEICRALAAFRRAEGLDERNWEPLTRSLTAAPDGVLADALSTPWMLTLAVSQLRAAGATAAFELARCPDTDAVRDKLFAALIPAAVEARPRDNAGHYQQERAHAWLARLARHLSVQREKGQGGTDIALHELWRMAGPRAPRYLHRLAVGLAVGLAFALAFGLMFRLASGLASALAGGLKFGLMFGLMFGLASGGLAGTEPQRSVWSTGGPGAMRKRLAFGLAFGLAGALTVGLAFRFEGGLMFGLAGGLAGGLMFGLAGGLAGGLMAGNEYSPLADARRVIHDDAAVGLTVGLAFGLASGLTVGLAVGLRFGFAGGSAGGSAAGFAAGLAFGLMWATASIRFLCASVLLSRRGAFPPRPVPFLRWAHSAGLLRITGGAYQFRHDTYREWLTQHPGVVHPPEGSGSRHPRHPGCDPR